MIRQTVCQTWMCWNFRSVWSTVFIFGSYIPSVKQFEMVLVPMWLWPFPCDPERPLQRHVVSETHLVNYTYAAWLLIWFFFVFTRWVRQQGLQAVYRAARQWPCSLSQVSTSYNRPSHSPRLTASSLVSNKYSNTYSNSTYSRYNNNSSLSAHWPHNNRFWWVHCTLVSLNS